ncbi:PP1RA phosphatase, partial [Caloenas nicobarica]|nr:PP1RA phosphatase [Caloenas nicobarica]
MGSGPIDPKELLKGLDCFLGRDGEVKSAEGIAKIFSLMKDSQKMVSRCIYLNILLQTRAQEILVKFIRIGGYKLLNAWLTSSKAANNVPFLQQLLLTLQHLPLTVDHLKQNNTAKLVKQLSKSSDDEELRRLASILVSDWMGVIRSQSSAQPAERDKKKRKDDNKSKTPAQEKPQEAKTEAKTEEIPEKKREKPKSQRTTAPSHAKFRSTGLEMETPSLAPVKKMNSAAATDKYNLKPVPIKRQNVSSLPGDAPPAEKKYKPLNTAPNAAKEIKVKIIPPQREPSAAFLGPLWVVLGGHLCLFGANLGVFGRHFGLFFGGNFLGPIWVGLGTIFRGQFGCFLGTIWVCFGTFLGPVRLFFGDTLGVFWDNFLGPFWLVFGASLGAFWGQFGLFLGPVWVVLGPFFGAMNVNKIKDFGEAAKRELLKDREAFETARRLSHDSMEEKVPWAPPRALALPPPLVPPGSGSRERFTQAEREKGILQEIFLSKESPPRPDPRVCAPQDGSGEEAADPGGAASPDPGGSKLPPVLANLMGSVGGGKAAPPGPAGPGPINMQDILSSIMV